MANNAVPTLKPSEVFEFVKRAIQAGRVPYVAGPAAIGKSQTIAQVADFFGMKLLDERLSQKLSEDLTGLPEKDEERGKAIYLPFENIPMEGDDIPEGFNGWMLLLDELPSASEEVLAASYSMILDHMIGGKKIHPKCVIVAAGNLSTDSAIARELPDTLITRMLCCMMKPNVKDWVKWANKLPDEKRVDSVISFVEENETMLYAPTDKGDRDELEAYPAPRGWEAVMDIVKNHEIRCLKKKPEIQTDSAGVPIKGSDQPSIEPLDRITVFMLSSAVGGIAGQSFRESYDEAITLPYVWEIAQSPASTRIPPTHIGKVKVIADLVDHFIDSQEQTRDNILTYVNRIRGEHAALFAKQIEDKLGNTATEKKTVESVQKRLDIDPLLGPGGGASNPVPFPQPERGKFT